MRNETVQKLSLYADIIHRQRLKVGAWRAVQKEPSLLKTEQQRLIEYNEIRTKICALSSAYQHRAVSKETASNSRNLVSQAQRNFEAKQISPDEYRAIYEKQLQGRPAGCWADLACTILDIVKLNNTALSASSLPTFDGLAPIFLCETMQDKTNFPCWLLAIAGQHCPALLTLISLKITYNSTFLNQ